MVPALFYYHYAVVLLLCQQTPGSFSHVARWVSEERQELDENVVCFK